MPSGTLARAWPRYMITNPMNFAASSMLISNPKANGILAPVFVKPRITSVAIGKCGCTTGAPGSTGAIEVIEPNSASVAGHPARESAIAWSATAAPKVLADERVT